MRHKDTNKNSQKGSIIESHNKTIKFYIISLPIYVNIKLLYLIPCSYVICAREREKWDHLWILGKLSVLVAIVSHNGKKA